MKYIKMFDDISLHDTPLVGNKNASLGYMLTQLAAHGIRVAAGFAITVDAYKHYVTCNNIAHRIQKKAKDLVFAHDKATIAHISKDIKELICQGTIPADLHDEIVIAYKQLAMRYGQPLCDVAVRSSAILEDMPGASFAGQQDTYLNIVGHDAILQTYKQCIASFFNERAIVYRNHSGFNHTDCAMAVGVQKMVRADLAVSGVAFSLDTDTGFNDVVLIEASYGLGELIVSGQVTPDSYLLFKPMMHAPMPPIIRKKLGNKKIKMHYTDAGATCIVPTSDADQKKYALSDQQIFELARQVIIIEKQYSVLAGCSVAMDIEWAIDGDNNTLYIIQARQETVHHKRKELPMGAMRQYRLIASAKKPTIITSGMSIGTSIVSGTARVIDTITDIHTIQEGDIIVTTMTDPDWVPIMKKVRGIVTNQGGRTCHAAIVSRELGITAVVGTMHATTLIHNGEMITLDCSQGLVGYVYSGEMAHSIEEIMIDKVPKIPVDVMVNIANPDNAFTVSALPVAGVGLARVEFIIAHMIGIHPLAILFPERVQDNYTKDRIDELTTMYSSKTEFFISTMAQGIAMIAASFYPRPVVVRFSDFKSNEYRDLIGGRYFEPHEENPMLGLRGASRYYSDLYSKAFGLECAAIKRVRNHMGLTNVKVMIPFVRTLEEARLVLMQMRKNGLERYDNGLEVIMMCEIPANILLIDQFSQFFDGFSIGSNDLTQLTLGVDRDSSLLAPLFDERDPAVKKMLALAIEGARRHKKKISICGQAPSDFPEIAQFLIARGVSSLSLNPDAVIAFLIHYHQHYATHGTSKKSHQSLVA